MEPKPLPFTKELVGISAKALAIHHDKLYAGYVSKVNELSEKFKKIFQEIIAGTQEGNATYSEIRSLKDAETFAVNGVYLHEWYFDVLGGDPSASSGQVAPELSKALVEKWGSVQEGLKYFSACAMASRGWSVLAWDTKAGALKHYNGDAHNQGGVWGCLPVIVLDCYEHAYFLDYGSDKKKYIEDFWKNFNWTRAEQLYIAAREVKLPE